MIAGGYLSVVYRQRQNFMRDKLQKFDIGVTDYPLLMILNKNQGLGCNEISKTNFINKSLVSKSVSKLIKLGYLMQKKDPNHRQRINLFLTDKGKGIIPEIRKITVEWEEKVMEDLSTDERKAFYLLMKKMYERSLRSFD